MHISNNNDTPINYSQVPNNNRSKLKHSFTNLKNIFSKKVSKEADKTKFLDGVKTLENSFKEAPSTRTKQLVHDHLKSLIDDKKNAIINKKVSAQPKGILIASRLVTKFMNIFTSNNFKPTKDDLKLSQAYQTLYRMKTELRDQLGTKAKEYESMFNEAEEPYQRSMIIDELKYLVESRKALLGEEESKGDQDIIESEQILKQMEENFAKKTN